RDLEGHLARVHVVVRAVHQLHLHVHHRIAREHTVLERFLHALLHRPDVFAGDRAAHDVVLVHEAGAGLPRLAVAHPVAVLSWSALVLGSIATEITGSGNFMASRMIGWPSSERVSPVFVSLRPIAAAMSPARTSAISSRLLACISSSRPMRSFLSLVLL